MIPSCKDDMTTTHCNIFHGDHHYCLFTDTQDEDECLCGCPGCEAARKEIHDNHQRELQEIKDYELRWEKGTMEQARLDPDGTCKPKTAIVAVQRNHQGCLGDAPSPDHYLVVDVKEEDEVKPFDPALASRYHKKLAEETAHLRVYRDDVLVFHMTHHHPTAATCIVFSNDNDIYQMVDADVAWGTNLWGKVSTEHFGEIQMKSGSTNPTNKDFLSALAVNIEQKFGVVCRYEEPSQVQSTTMEQVGRRASSI